MDNSSGALGETAAAEYLEDRGFRILERNYHSRFGEIDIIAENGQYILFAEVKTRDAVSLVNPLESVSPAKRKKIAKTAMLYLQKHRTPLQPRFDVIGITTSGKNHTVRSLRHIENAFEFSAFL